MFSKIKYPLFIFIGACSYGLLSSLIKLAYRQGFEFGETISSQYFFGWLLLCIAFLFSQRKSVSKKQVALLALVGTSTSLTGIFYYLSLKVIPASIAVVLLFQFTWIGVVIEAIVERKLPSKDKVISTILIFIGTLFAGNILIASHSSLNVTGVLYGLISAIAFAIFIYVSGRVEVNIPPIQRSFLMTTGAVILLIVIFSPSFLYNGSLPNGLWKYGLLLSFFGVLIPVVFYAIGGPHVHTGLAAILGAGELPVAVITSIIILKESVTILQWFGIIIIFIGIAVAQVRQFKS